SIDDGHRVSLDEVEVSRRELSLIEVDGRRGEPARRLRTIREAVRLEIGPYLGTGHIHRGPTSPPPVALTRWPRVLPVTNPLLVVESETAARDGEPRRHEVLLVNRDRIRAYEALSEPEPGAEAGGAAGATDAAAGGIDEPSDAPAAAVIVARPSSEPAAAG